MLSTNPTSNLQQRRQQHQRQQSLEVPILATPLSAHQRLCSPQRAHRRGQSLDQRPNARSTPTGFRPLHPQEQLHLQASTAQNTNTGQNYPPQDLQHYKQETQQHLPGQPGLPAADFQTHLQQQLHGRPVNVDPQQIAFERAEDAKAELQKHIQWFATTYGGSAPNITISTSPATDFPPTIMSNMPMNQQQQHIAMAMHGIPPSHTPNPHPHPHTVPNTPQHHARPWSSPVLINGKHERSQSFQLDTAPMSGSFDIHAGDLMAVAPAEQVHFEAFTHDNLASFGGAQSYASSAYSSSVADAHSPPAYNTPHMPTLAEEPDLIGTAFDVNAPFIRDGSTILDTTGGADEQDNQFLYQPQALSPRAAALASLGGINASIEDTGISSEEVTQYMSEQNPANSRWTCLYPGCGKDFGRKENIRAHVQTHLGDRQFKCNDCGKCFVRQHDLKRHAKIHSGVKAHVCPCNMSFARQDALTRHRQRGMCEGVLPGFEKNEEDRKPRGRPRKERPDMETRAEKATRARHMDTHYMSDDNTTIGAGNNILSYHHASPEYTATAIDQFLAAADEQYLSASSDSGASDRSFPVTPPDTQSDMYEDINFNEFVDPVAVDALGNTEFDFSSGTGGSWRADTPPSSPPYDYSSPLDALSPPSDCAPMQDFELMGGLGGVMQYLEQPNYVGFEGM
nr:hypothetical protein B0A51_17808 [Rachicladosporium sp. CCFEE 5018]